MKNLHKVILVTAVAVLAFVSHTQASTVALDPSFYTRAGYRAMDVVADKSDYAKKTLIDSSGNMFVVGNVQNDTQDIEIVKLDANGSVVTTFAASGYKSIDLDGRNDFAVDAVLDEVNGCIIIAGYVGEPKDVMDFFVVKVKAADGALDTSFNLVGWTSVDVGGSTIDYATAMAVDSSGRIIVVGYSTLSSSLTGVGIICLLSNGTLDPDFGVEGKLTIYIPTTTTTTAPSSNVTAVAIALTREGYIYVAGQSGGVGSHTAKVICLSNVGVSCLFGADGIVSVGLGLGDEQVTALGVDDNGNIVLAGQFANSLGVYDVFVARINSGTGALDATFNASGTPGYIVQDLGTAGDYVSGFVFDENQKIVLMGQSQGTTSDIVLARFNSNGTLDTSFNLTGLFTQDLSGGNDQGFSVILDASRRVVVTGITKPAGSSYYDFLVARFAVTAVCGDGAIDGSETCDDGNATDDGNGCSATCQQVCFVDGDGDGFGAGAAVAATGSSCAAGQSYNADDCDDTNAMVNPDATEICNRGIDDDCDGSADESDARGAVTRYRDFDRDTYGDTADTLTSCVRVAGYISRAEDCDDGNASINPGATDVCDVSNLNCDDHIDACAGEPDDGDDDSETDDCPIFYQDADGDGFGDANQSVKSCEDVVEGYTTVVGDCDDEAANSNPNGAEVCGDGVDQDCSGVDVACCGNHLLDSGETCDDGNQVASDGCSASCQIEAAATNSNTSGATVEPNSEGSTVVATEGGESAGSTASGANGCSCDLTATGPGAASNAVFGMIFFVSSAWFGIRRKVRK